MKAFQESRQYETYMDEAIAQARAGEALGDVPVGAVIIRQGKVISAAHNRRIIDSDPTAHAEILAIRAAATSMGDWRLEGCTLVVTLEPCCMCAGAIVLARLERVVYGAADPRAGAVESLYNIVGDERLNHRVNVTSGVLAKECGEILTKFFEKKRGKTKAP